MRDVRMDLRRLKEHFGVTTIACLLNEAELRSLSVRNYKKDVEASGLVFLSLPMIDMAPPDDFDEVRRCAG